ncbi:MAG: M15 family metallopeptidase [Candidatus Nomurabacteria bacterium]|nr:M15 family metallopeptidase [Candidatus Nomurabacteria bacterium]
MQNFLKNEISKKIFFPLLFVVFCLFTYISYGYIKNIKKFLYAVNNFETTKINSEKRINDLERNILKLKEQNDLIFQTIDSEKTKTGSISTIIDQINNNLGEISNNVSDLERLSKTDSELLKKYSKNYFLNEHYIPLSLIDIETKYLNNKTRTLQIHSNVYQDLKNILDNANGNGMTLQIASAYRSFETQAILKSEYRIRYGAGTANSFSAEQGYSEHQLGTTVDFTTQKIGGKLEGFDKTPEYSWLLENAYKYGFIISYPKSNIYYKFEPWHWRFVGIALATKIHDDNTYFYNLDQRIIDTYLANIFD